MLFSAALVAVGAAAVSAQTTVPKYDSSLNMTIDPGSVDPSLRSTWCEAEYNTCQLLCDDDTDQNLCTQADLNYTCSCTSNSSAPDLQDYSQTMPTFICETLYSQCIGQQSTQEGQDECKKNIKDLCGTLAQPSKPIGASSTTSSATTSTAKATKTASKNDDVTTTTSDGFAAPTMGPAGNGVFAVAAVGLFAYMV